MLPLVLLYLNLNWSNKLSWVSFTDHSRFWPMTNGWLATAAVRPCPLSPTSIPAPYSYWTCPRPRSLLAGHHHLMTVWPDIPLNVPRLVVLSVLSPCRWYNHAPHSAKHLYHMVQTFALCGLVQTCVTTGNVGCTFCYSAFYSSPSPFLFLSLMCPLPPPPQSCTVG